MDQITSGRVPDVYEETRKLISQIPRGKVSTYGAVAEALGDIRASRFVAIVQKMTPGAAAGRIVRSDGSLGSASAARAEVAEMSRRLRAEGVLVTRGRVVNLDLHSFAEFKTSRPLEALRTDQRGMRDRLEIPSRGTKVEAVAGVDVAYDGDRAWAALVSFSFPAGKRMRTDCAVSEAKFPYIPTYLAYRELPLVKPLVTGLEEGTLLMYDGNGILHPEGFGVASHAGVLFGLPTIGVAKRLLCGSTAESGKSDAVVVRVKGKVAGYALSRGSSAPVYVSPGHGVGHKQTLSVARSFLKYRIPEPVRAAHAFATSERRSATNK